MTTLARVGETVAAVNAALITLSLPAGSAAGDLALVFWHTNTGGDGKQNPMAGWRLFSPDVYGSNGVQVWAKTLTAADITAGSVKVYTGGTTKQAAALHVSRPGDATSLKSISHNHSQSASITSATTALTSQPTGLTVEVYFERAASTPSTGVTIGGGATQRASAFGTGAAGCSVTIGDHGSGSGTRGGDTATWNTSQSTHTAICVQLGDMTALPGGAKCVSHFAAGVETVIAT